MLEVCPGGILKLRFDRYITKFRRNEITPSHNHATLLLHNTQSQKLVSAKQKLNAQSAKINSRKNFMPHGTPTQLVLYRPSIIIIIYLQFQFKQFDKTSGLGWCPAWECRLSRVTSSFHTLSAVRCGKLLVFIQYIISIQSRFYGSPVYTFWCLVPLNPDYVVARSAAITYLGQSTYSFELSPFIKIIFSQCLVKRVLKQFNLAINACILYLIARSTYTNRFVLIVNRIWK